VSHPDLCGAYRAWSISGGAVVGIDAKVRVWQALGCVAENLIRFSGKGRVLSREKFFILHK
jgi:hypothetical protein